ncbi:hypothetical protein CP973_03950 [Streptomyces albofaciens JCM 4342]|uniref:hypothetical protein n=1 Tax=Streptomyces albofaciens TaxID=66866 RepID=UPI001239A41F|nr:hypothetical protein [Streptomyces albofaciens]KAA6221241.1 hypothetical protein CP973_03950 [Streptomyces albofaciens JCM 4342]
MRRPLTLALVCASVLLGGCAATGDPKSAGRTPAASAPERVWTGSKPPEPLGPPNSAGRPMPLRALPRVPSGDIHQVAPLTIARGAAEPMDPSDDTAKKIKECRAIGQRPCAVQAPRYRDLNGDGKDDLLLAVDTGGSWVSLWAFTVKDGVLTQILGVSNRVRSVELAGRDVIAWEPVEAGGYDMRRIFSWDERLQAMNERVTEYVESSPRK